MTNTPTNISLQISSLWSETGDLEHIQPPTIQYAHKEVQWYKGERSGKHQYLTLCSVDEVWGDVATVKLHALDDLQLIV